MKGKTKDSLVTLVAMAVGILTAGLILRVARSATSTEDSSDWTNYLVTYCAMVVALAVEYAVASWVYVRLSGGDRLGTVIVRTFERLHGSDRRVDD